MLAALQGQHAGVVNVCVVLFQLFEEATGAEQEHAAVPEIATGLDEFIGAFLVRFFHELGDPAHAFGQQCIIDRLDVAVAGFRLGRRHAEQHHLATLGCHGGQGQGALQGFLVVDDVVGGQHQHQLVTAFADQFHGGDGHGRCGIAAEGFHQNALGLQLQVGQLLVDDEAVVLVADHDGRVHPIEYQAGEGLLEQGVFAGQGQELLGELLARQRPQTRTATTGEDYWDHGCYSKN
ncbi:hypothetical protein D3C76_519170 [compost metagenome]